MRNELNIIGGGLAGSEAAWQAAERGINVSLFEMRPHVSTPAHHTGYLGEIICSNSLGSKLPDRSSGILQSELTLLRSLLLDCAEKCAVPAGSALAVDRDQFSQMVTEKIINHRNIHIIREEIKKIPKTTTIIASGPLTSPALSKTIQKISGQNNLFFFDAIAPIIEYNSINMKTAFFSSRYQRGEKDEGDYINCPLNKEEYFLFVNELKNAKRIIQKDFEKATSRKIKSVQNLYFEACLPIEVIASRSENALAYGPMRPVGIHNPSNNLHPYAVVQLRQDNIAGSLFNMVGFQTTLTYTEQARVFRMIPGLEQAHFMRFGQMHRNTFICSPNIIKTTLQTIKRDDLFFAGQIVGIEGYLGNIASGVVAGINASKYLQGESLISFPSDTLIGALCHYISHADSDNFQPMKANIGLFPPLEKILISRRQRAKEHAKRSLVSLEQFICENHIL